jgi:hypothetical protein
LERKLKTGNQPNIDNDVLHAKSKKKFDIAARQFKAFVLEWNQARLFILFEI